VAALAQISAGGATYAVRRAAPADVVPIVELMVADQIGTPRDDPSDPARYLAAFEAIDADPAHLWSSPPTAPATSSRRCSSRSSPASRGAAGRARRSRPSACARTCARAASAAR
jgi:hypothetical protein